MGIDIRWEDERGKLLEEIPDPKGYLELSLSLMSLDETFCLRFIDPYGDTVFNQQQIPVFIRELQALQKLMTPDRIPTLSEHSGYNSDTLVKASVHISQVLALAARSTNRVHTYLKFYGD